MKAKLIGNKAQLQEGTQVSLHYNTGRNYARRAKKGIIVKINKEKDLIEVLLNGNKHKTKVQLEDDSENFLIIT